MNKKEHLRGVPTLLQNEKTRKDYKANTTLQTKTKTKKVEHLTVILKSSPT